jgi:hypothetical protein
MNKMNEEVKEEVKDFSIQVTSINGVQSTIHFQNTESFVKLKTESRHQTWRAYKSKSNKLLKLNRTLIDLLYVDRFLRILHDKYGIRRLEVSPCALCEIISVLLDQKKRRMISKDQTKVYYLYSNKTLAYAQFFKMLHFADKDSQKSMETLLNLYKEHDQRIKMWNEKRSENHSTSVPSSEEAREDINRKSLI